MVVSLLLLVCLAFLQILLRNLFDTGIGWADPFLRMLVLWVTFFGAMIATREKHHISVDLLSRYLKKQYLPFVNLITGCFSAMICWLVAWYALELVKFEYQDGYPAFGVVPVWCTQIIIPLGFGVMALRFSLQTCAEMVRIWKIFSQGPKGVGV